MSKPKKTTLSEMSWHGKNLAMWREKSFVDIDMGNEDLSGKSFYKIKFTNCDLRGCDLAYTDFRECKFENTLMDWANFESTKFDNCQFDGCKFDFTKMKQMQIKDSQFNNCNLHNTLWTGEFCDTLFLDCDMSYLEMCEVNMAATIIRNCNLEKAKIIVSDVSRVDFTFSMLNGYSLSNLKEAKNLDLTSREMAMNSKGSRKKIVSSRK